MWAGGRRQGAAEARGPRRGTAEQGTDPAPRRARPLRPSAPRGPAAPPLRHRPRGPQSVSQPVDGAVQPACTPVPLLRVCSRSRRQPADHPQRGAAHALPPVSDEMSFRFAGADQCPPSGPLQGARGTPVPAEQTDRSRMLPKLGDGSQGPDLLSSSGLRPVSRVPPGWHPWQLTLLPFLPAVSRWGRHSLSSVCGQRAQILL